MQVTLLREAGYDEALLGLSLSYNQTSDKMASVAAKLFNHEGGHNKFLESIAVWLDVSAARYFWQQFDTYRVGVTKQSESTMHTLLKRPLTPDHFEGGLYAPTLDRLNALRDAKDFLTLKRELPESFFQRRVVFTNYMSLRRIFEQRLAHKLDEWKFFCNAVRGQLAHPEFVRDLFNPSAKE